MNMELAYTPYSVEVMVADVPHDQWQKGVTLKGKVGLFDGIIYHSYYIVRQLTVYLISVEESEVTGLQLQKGGL